MPRHCSGHTTMDSECKVTYGLNRLFISMPEKEDPEIKYLCQEHCKKLIDELQYIENGIKLQIKELTRKFSHNKVSSEAMEIVGVDKRSREAKTKLEEKLKDMRWNQCRNLDCLKPIEQSDYLCSIVIMSSRGKFRTAFYFHRQCFDHIRAKCGVRLPIHSGQLTILQTI